MTGAFTLSRYIAKLFIVSITATLGICALLIFMIDFVELLRMSGKFGSSPGRRWSTSRCSGFRPTLSF